MVTLSAGSQSAGAPAGDSARSSQAYSEFCMHVNVVDQVSTRVRSSSTPRAPQASTPADGDRARLTLAGNRPAGVPAGDSTRSAQAFSWRVSFTKAVNQVSARAGGGAEAPAVLTASNSAVYLLEFYALYPVLLLSSDQEREEVSSSAKRFEQFTAGGCSVLEACTPQATTPADVNVMVTLSAGSKSAGAPAGDSARSSQAFFLFFFFEK